MYAAVTDIPENYRKGLGSLSHFTWDSAFWVFNAVANFAYPRYNVVVDDIKTVQNQLEGQFLLRQKEVEEKAVKLLSSSRAECLLFLTNYSKEAGKSVYTTWRKLSEDLLLKYMDGVKKNEHFKTVNVGYPEQFRGEIVKESGENLKVKKLPGENEMTLGAHISAAKELIKQKNYSAAKTELEAVLKLDPNNSWAKEELKKVKRVMQKIDGTAPHEIMLVVDAGTGQNAINQVQEFDLAVGLTGLTITKLDGTAKGGVLFNIASRSHVPIRFIGVGEKIDDLRPFSAKSFVAALFQTDDKAS